MDAKTCKDNIRACVSLCGSCDRQGSKCHEFEKGYLEAISGPEVRILVEALERIAKEDSQCHGQIGRDCWQVAIDTLDEFKSVTEGKS